MERDYDWDRGYRHFERRGNVFETTQMKVQDSKLGNITWKGHGHSDYDFDPLEAISIEPTKATLITKWSLMDIFIHPDKESKQTVSYIWCRLPCPQCDKSLKFIPGQHNVTGKEIKIPAECCSQGFVLLTMTDEPRA